MPSDRGSHRRFGEPTVSDERADDQRHRRRRVLAPNVEQQRALFGRQLTSAAAIRSRRWSECLETPTAIRIEPTLERLDAGLLTGSTPRWPLTTLGECAHCDCELAALHLAFNNGADDRRAKQGDGLRMIARQKRIFGHDDSIDSAGMETPSRPSRCHGQIEWIVAKRQAALDNWESANPSPKDPAKKAPTPQELKLDPNDVFSSRQTFYHEPLGKSGAEIGGVLSTNAIHGDGHTWFSPGWSVEPVMHVLESNVPGIVETQMADGNGLVTATKRTAWLKRLPNGTFEVAPPGSTNLVDAGYLKSSIITPTDPKAMRTVFPEVNQT